MPEMRYIGVDLLTRQVVEDLPLYGVSLQRRIRGAGNMTASFKLGTGVFSDPDLENATETGLRALFVLRDNLCIWGGPFWSRTFQSQSNSEQLTGQSFESVFSAIEVLSRFKRTKTDQTTVFKDLITTMQAQPSSNFGFDTSLITPTGVLVDLTVETYEHRMYSDAIDELLKASNSFDYVIDPVFDPSDNSFDLLVRTGYPYMGFGQGAINLEYPGQISNYYWSESAGKGGVIQTLLGAGEGTAMPVAVKPHADLLAAGYPAWAKIDSEKGIRDRTRLTAVAEEYARVHKTPVVTPTVEFEVTQTDFAEWNNLGAPVNFHVTSAKHPGGKDLTSRMLGWDYSPPESDNKEQLRIILEGQD
jgi:hypothetical protein